MPAKSSEKWKLKFRKIKSARHENLWPASAVMKKQPKVIRKTARLANYYNSSKWYILYVQLPHESADKIALDKQRHLINNFKLATELGAEVIKIEHTKIAKAIIEQAENKGITTVCIGKPRMNLFKIILSTNVFKELLNKLSSSEIDLIILS